MGWFQAILCILMLIVLAHWIYGRFISDRKGREDTPPVRGEAPVSIEARVGQQRAAL